MDHTLELPNPTECTKKEEPVISFQGTQLGGIAISGQFEVPPSYPNDREWAQMNLLA